MNDYTDPPVDPFEDAANSLLYSDPNEAAAKLRHLMINVVPQINAANDRVAAEQRRSNDAMEKFRREEERFTKDPDAVALAEHHVYREYLDDFQRTGAFDVEKFRKDNGRDPPPRDVANMHFQMRAAGLPGIRSFDECLRASARKTAEKLPGAYLRERDPQVNAKRRVGEMIADRAGRRGMDPQAYREQHASRQPNLDYGGEPATPQTMARQTLAGFGDGVGDDADAARTANRRNAVAQMAASRTGPNVRVSRDASDYRYPDRVSR